MDVFAFRNGLVSEYERFSRSFTRIRADDIRQRVDEWYAAQTFLERHIRDSLERVGIHVFGGEEPMDYTKLGKKPET